MVIDADGVELDTPETEEVSDVDDDEETEEVVMSDDLELQSIQIPSPVYTLTGTAPADATAIRIEWKNGDQSDSYELTKFEQGDVDVENEPETGFWEYCERCE